jgi:hypothetical protein
MTDEGLVEFAANLGTELRYEAEVDGAEAMLPEVFTRRMISAMVDDGDLDEEAIQVYHLDESVRPAIEVSGYSIQDDDTLNLVATIFAGGPPQPVPPADVRRAIRRAQAFWQRCRQRPYHDDLEESSDAWDMALAVRRSAKKIRRVRTFVVTDGIARLEFVDAESDEGVEYLQSIWDLRRLHRLETTGRRGDPIEIDFLERFGRALPVLPAPIQSDEYRAFMTVIPGDWLALIYDEYGSRLLERNVRSFLQFTGKVNKGLRDTIRNEPGRFLAYNNGISATASDVELTTLSGGGHGISRMRDLQIVNGGQTTASIHRSWRSKLSDLAGVAVQAKITEVDGELLDELVPRISEYANSQNKVQMADLSSNLPFHIELESLSRNTWAPATAVTVGQTKWFYERARGQYSDALNRARSRPDFQKINPPKQRVSKVELATYENTWDLEPHEVSRGAQKNFHRFMLRIGASNARPDVTYLQQAIAKAILFRRAEVIVRNLNFGGYRRNIVTYALARLSHATRQQLDLSSIWTDQQTPAAVDDAIEALAHIAYRVLTDPDRPSANVTEWAKRSQCWDQMIHADWSVPDQLRPHLTSAAKPRASDGVSAAADVVHTVHARLDGITGEIFMELADWAQLTTSLSAFDRALAKRLGIALKQRRELTVRQRPEAVRLLDEAERLGFRHS